MRLQYASGFAQAYVPLGRSGVLPLPKALGVLAAMLQAVFKSMRMM
jgi:hypothetical protein